MATTPEEYARRVKSMRPKSRRNADGSGSTVIMASGGNGKEAYPLLYPKDPNNVTSDPKDWIEYPNTPEGHKKAYAEAKKRGEIFSFNSVEEANSFAEGSWKQTLKDIGEWENTTASNSKTINNKDNMATGKPTAEDYAAIGEAMANSSSGKRKKIMEMLNTGMNIGAVLMDLGISGSQIREGQRLRGDIRDPEMFTPTRDRSLLRERIGDARRNIGDVSQDLAPAELANLDQYLADIGNARIASGGQASIFGAMGNAAALRRRRGGMEISALGSQIKRQNRGELNQLIGIDLADRSAYEGRKLSANELALQRYYKETEDAAGLEAAGRSNQRESIYNLLPNLSQGLGQIGQMDFSGIGTGFGNMGRGIGRGFGNLFNKRVPQLKFGSGSSPGETMDVFRNSINLEGY